MRIDPHTHSLCSDGTDTPTELVHLAAAAGLGIVGLTDHDTVAGWDEATAAAQQAGIGLLRGTEFSCAAAGRTVHLLGYLFDPDDADLLALMQRTRAARSERVAAFVERLSRDYPLTLDDVLAQVPPGAPAGRPHIADALVALGAFTDRSAVFQHVLHPSGPYYVKLWSADVHDVQAAVQAAGGVCVYAHPRATQRQKLVPTSTIARMANAGLFALEAVHRDHSAEMQVAVRTIATHYGMRVTGASDYHGWGKPNRLGEHLTAPEVVRELVARGRLPLVGAQL